MLDIKTLRTSKNIAEHLNDEQLAAIGQSAVQGYAVDEASRSEWKNLVDKAMDIAKQTMTVKNHPWPNASNVKYPLITQAAIEFASRTLPELIHNQSLVKTLTVGQDPEGLKRARAERVSTHMSYQLLQQSDEWEESMDSLLSVLPVLGTVFKKTYFDPIEKRPISELCHPESICVNHDITCLEKARRITHKLTLYRNDVIERIRAELYRNVEVELLLEADGAAPDDQDAPVELLEQHCFLDLDEDGYKEPYIVVVHEKSGQVLRIVSRFEKVTTNSNGEISKIDPVHYFTDYHFIKAPDGGFYSSGLGTLLYPLNHAINTLINQLIDAGTLNNSQGGFLGRGLRLKNGEFRLNLGEWRVLDAASGTNLAQNIVPLPTKEPSQTLFALLGLLIDIGRDLTSLNDAMKGKGPSQNVPATTMLTMVEQGMKVYNAVHKRLYRSLKKEFKKIFDLNRKHLTDAEYRKILDNPEARVAEDYNAADLDIMPVADPTMSTDAQRLAKAQAIMALPTVDPIEATKYYLEAIKIEPQEMERLIVKPDPNKVDPEALKAQAEVAFKEASAKKAIVEAQVISETQLLELEKVGVMKQDAATRAEEAAARIFKMKQDALNNSLKVDLAEAKAAHEANMAAEAAGLKRGQASHDAVMSEIELAHKKEKDKAELMIKAAKEESSVEIEKSKLMKEDKSANK